MTRRLITGKAARALAAIRYVVTDESYFGKTGGKRVSFTDEHGHILVTMVYESEKEWFAAQNTWQAVRRAAVEKLIDRRA